MVPNINMVEKILKFKNMEQYEDKNLYKNGYEYFLNKHYPYPEFDDLKQLLITFDKKLKK
jgi:hypothetical protein